MKKILFFACIILLCVSCNKNRSNNQSYIDHSVNNPSLNIQSNISVENFRKPGMDDYQTILAACDSLPENSNIGFAQKTYLLSHTVIVQKSFHFHGPATFKRENQVTYTLKKDADETSTYLVLTSTEDLIKEDRFSACISQDGNGATAINAIKDIKGDTVILYIPLGKTFGGVNLYPAGTKLFKSIMFFWVLSATKYTDMSCSFDDLTFDGNRGNNTGSFFWNINAAITAITKGITFYKNCSFFNSPNETIVGHNADIRNCSFYNLNGSGFHSSADKQNCTEAEIHSLVIDNTFENTNQVPDSITGHSEGAITHSNSGGYYTATGNTFRNIGESVLGGLYPSISVNDWGTSNIIFTGNTIDGAGRMVFLIDTRPGDIHNVVIENNIISNMPSLNWADQLSYWPGILLKDKSGE